jgi:hypothetical protein
MTGGLSPGLVLADIQRAAVRNAATHPGKVNV